MSNQINNAARRRFLKLATVGAAAPLIVALIPRSAFGADLPHLDLNDPTAKSLHYTEDASTAADQPTYKAGSACASCQFFQGAAGDGFGPCTLYAGKAVSAKGWCAGYNKKP